MANKCLSTVRPAVAAWPPPSGMKTGIQTRALQIGVADCFPHHYSLKTHDEAKDFRRSPSPGAVSAVNDYQSVTMIYLEAPIDYKFAFEAKEAFKD